MTAKQRQQSVERWRNVALQTLATAELAFAAGHWRSAASRAYYAAYQAATVACFAHGDESSFPPNWRNPSHDQLPELIRNNGDLPLSARRVVSTLLISLRATRENADYRPGVTLDRQDALKRLQGATNVLRLLGALPNGKN